MCVNVSAAGRNYLDRCSALTHWGRNKMDAISQMTFSNTFDDWMSLEISLKFVINKIPALVKIMVWRRPGDKPLSEPMMVSLQTHICVTRPQWVKSKQNKWYCADVIFKCIFLNAICAFGCIFQTDRGNPVDNKESLVKVMAFRLAWFNWHKYNHTCSFS